MITIDDARALRAAGLVWKPASGDAFTLTRAEIEGDVFTLSDMTIEPHEFETGTILGFNGTTEWALDSVAIEDALWLPREDQLRELLGPAFRTLERPEPSGAFSVSIVVLGDLIHFQAPDAATAYARALLALIQLAVD